MKAALVVTLSLFAVALALLNDVLTSLPSIALGSPILLITLRAALFFIVLYGISITTIKAWNDELPVEFGARGIRFEATENLEDVKRNLDKLQGQLDSLWEEVNGSWEKQNSQILLERSGSV